MMDILVDMAMDLQLNSLSAPFHLPVKVNKNKKIIIISTNHLYFTVSNVIKKNWKH